VGQRCCRRGLPGSGDEAEVEGESEDGNLIEGQGIFLGKKDNGRSNKVEMSTPVPHGFGS
jgi:hypothetical protein